jgi:ubiquinone/menaquinone biosynthesis C-methylase UbiE
VTTLTEWDYSTLAAFYDHRAEYAAAAIDGAIAAMHLSRGDVMADVGAGTGKLARPMAERGLVVHAVEPNDEMRSHGIRNTEGLSVSWRAGTGERTGLPDRCVRAVTFGSSFNVVEQKATLRECRRIVEPRGWFCCMWNHRDLDDPLQARIEAVIREAIPGYHYGSRREDPTAVLAESELFEDIHPFAASFAAVMTRDAVMDAWRSHGTLARQAGPAFDEILDAISATLTASEVRVPYTTRGWHARFSR